MSGVNASEPGPANEKSLNERMLSTSVAQVPLLTNCSPCTRAGILTSDRGIKCCTRREGPSQLGYRKYRWRRHGHSDGLSRSFYYRSQSHPKLRVWDWEFSRTGRVGKALTLVLNQTTKKIVPQMKMMPWKRMKVKAQAVCVSPAY
jgi:hypothetical protein